MRALLLAVAVRSLAFQLDAGSARRCFTLPAAPTLTWLRMSYALVGDGQRAARFVLRDLAAAAVLLGVDEHPPEESFAVEQRLAAGHAHAFCWESAEGQAVGVTFHHDALRHEVPLGRADFDAQRELLQTHRRALAGIAENIKSQLYVEERSLEALAQHEQKLRANYCLKAAVLLALVAVQAWTLLRVFSRKLEQMSALSLCP